MVREDSSSEGVGVRDALTTGRCDLVVGSTDSRDDIRVADAVSRREPRQEIHAGKLGNFEKGFRFNPTNGRHDETRRDRGVGVRIHWPRTKIDARGFAPDPLLAHSFDSAPLRKRLAESLSVREAHSLPLVRSCSGTAPLRTPVHALPAEVRRANEGGSLVRLGSNEVPLAKSRTVRVASLADRSRAPLWGRS